MVTCWERADLLALLYVKFPCVFVTFPYSVLGEVWYLIVSFHDIYLLSYFVRLYFSFHLFLQNVLLANSGDPDQTPHFLACDLGLHC